MEFDTSEAQRFVGMLYEEPTLGVAAPGWYGLSWIPDGGKMKSRAYDNVEDVISRAEKLDAAGAEGIYLRVTTMGRKPRSYERGLSRDSERLFGLWSDIDYGVEGHRHSPDRHGGLRLPRDADEALSIVGASALPEPSWVVNSGGGLYAWWALDEPLLLDGAEGVDAAEALSSAWQLQLQAGAASQGLYYGAGLGDLARVLRLPGSVNRKTKQERRCRIVADGGPRYSLEALSEALDVAGAIVERPEDTRHRGVVSALSEEELEELEFKKATDPGPFDLLADQVGIARILEAAGWSECECGGRREVEACWTRPGGGSTTAHSAHTLKENPHVLVCHSAEAGLPVGGNQRLTAGRLFSWLWHEGDLSAATYDLLAAMDGRDASEGACAMVAAGLRKPGPVRRGVLRLVSDGDSADSGEDPADEDSGEGSGGPRSSEMPRPEEVSLSDPKISYVAAAEIRDALYEASAVQGGVPRLVRWRDEWLRWTGSHWENYETAALRKWVYDVMRAGGSKKLVDDALDALAASVLVTRDVEQPSWIGRPIAGVFTGCRNGILRLDDRELSPCDPAFFNGFAVGCEWDEGAQEPTRWLSFLKEVLGEDDQIQLLQEWFGYVLSGRVDLEKALLVLGPPRSGKGTIVQVLKALVGAGSVASPAFATLGEMFGLQPLIGKRLAVIGDARMGNRANHTALEVLLSVIGLDDPDIHRKNKTAFQGKSQVLFMMLSNNIPSFDDPSGAIISRFEIISTRKSFDGEKADTGLKRYLVENELQGILRWALDGYDRISQPGAKLTVPASTVDAKSEMAGMVAPLREFVEEHCVVEEGAWVATTDLYERYDSWVTLSDGGGKAMPKVHFTRAFRATCADARPFRRRTDDGGRIRGYSGIRLS